MSRSPKDWEREIAAFQPQSCDYARLREIEDASLLEGIDWDADLREELQAWQAYLQHHGLAVPLEQCCGDWMLLPRPGRAVRLAGCPPQARQALDYFFDHALEAFQEELAWRTALLVQIVRERRTGRAQWAPASASGSPEVLAELMFRWGPRFTRHRWTWS